MSNKLTRRYLIQTEHKAQAMGIAPATTHEVSALEQAWETYGKAKCQTLLTEDAS